MSQQSRQMPPWRLALLPLLPASVVFLILASVAFLILASVVFLTVALEVHSLALAPVVLFLISVAPLAHRTLVAGFSVIFRAALRATAIAGLQALATAVTGGGTAPMASMSMAITALPIPMPMTGATTPTPPGDTEVL